MKICICCSLSFTNEVLALAKELEKRGFELLLPITSGNLSML